jgi:hypothetical protein
MPSGHYLNLDTILKDGSIPESRLNDPVSTHAIVQQLIRANRKRSATDSEVAGLMDGNPPYLSSELRKNAQSWRCNTNWRIGEAFLNVGLTSYWDVVTEAENYAQVRTAHGNADQREEWSGIITEEFDKLNRKNCQTADQSLNYMFRLSHHDMVLYRCGPVIFDDSLNFRARAIKQHMLLVPDETPSCVNEWTMAVIRVDETADRLYSFIRFPKIAEKIGYDVKSVRKALINAVHQSHWPRNHRYDWQWYEQRLRNNDLFEATVSATIPLAHVYWREFPKEGEHEGRISHAIVLEDAQEAEFLFRRVGRYANWHEAVHPFYYDTGDGTHHSVKGLGIKAYGALETYNRMQCHAVDSAIFDSASHWQAADSSSLNNSAVVTMGPFLIHPPGLTLLPFAPSGKLDGLIAIKEDTRNTLTANLAQYRQDSQRKRYGNEPPTARQVTYEAQNEQTISRSGITWYLEQLDDFYSERFRRAANPNLVDTNPGGRDALAFQEACVKRKVPKVALAHIESVRATRTVGYGSADARLQSMFRLLNMAGMYDEQGRRRILEDITTAEVGRTQMRRYLPQEGEPPQLTAHHSQAQDKVVGMKNGVMPLVTPDQNPVVFAGSYLQAAAQAAGSLQQGADLMVVFSFLSVAGPAIRAQLDRFAQDPSRKEVYEALNEQWEALAKLHDKLEQQVQKQQQERQKAMQNGQAQMNEQMMDFQLRQRELQGKQAISVEKARGNAELRRFTALQKQQMEREAHVQNLALEDAETASTITRKSAETAAAVQMKRQQSKAKSE